MIKYLIMLILLSPIIFMIIDVSFDMYRVFIKGEESTFM